jgi:hypothetical protein
MDKNIKRIIPNVPLNFNRNSTEAYLKKLKINQVNSSNETNVIKNDNKIKISEKSTFMRLNTSPKKKVHLNYNRKKTMLKEKNTKLKQKILLLKEN